MSTRLALSTLIAITVCAPSCSTTPAPQGPRGAVRLEPSESSVETEGRPKVPRNLADETHGDPDPFERGDDVESDPWLPLSLRLVDVFEDPRDPFFSTIVPGPIRIELKELPSPATLEGSDVRRPGLIWPMTRPDYGLYAKPIP